jgi:hypothetical protein
MASHRFDGSEVTPQLGGSGLGFEQPAILERGLIEFAGPGGIRRFGQ